MEGKQGGPLGSAKRYADLFETADKRADRGDGCGDGSDTYECDLAVACMFRNSVFYLREWIEFHLLVGVQRFYLCDNLSVDGPMDILEPYVERGTVVLLRADSDFGTRFVEDLQTPFLTAVARAVRGRVKWLACIDTDEFLAPSRASDATLLDVLARHEDAAAIAVNWQMYGSSCIRRKPDDRLIIETFLHRAHTQEPVNRHIKLIVRPERVRCFHDPHSVHVEPGAPGRVRLTNGRPIAEATPCSHFVMIDELRINHYMTGDVEYFERYKVPAYRNWVENEHVRASTVMRARQGTCSDTLDATFARRFAPLVRRRMGIDTVFSLPDAIGTGESGGTLCLAAAPTREPVCVVLQLWGQPDRLDFCEGHLANLQRAGIECDFYVTVGRSVWTDSLRRRLATLLCPAAAASRTSASLPVQVVLVDDGRDAARQGVVCENDNKTSRFLSAMHCILYQCRRSYASVLCVSIDGATDNGRDGAFDVALGSPARVRKCLSILEDDARRAVAADMGYANNRHHRAQETKETLVGCVGQQTCLASVAPSDGQRATFRRLGLGALSDGATVCENAFWANGTVLFDALASLDLVKCARLHSTTPIEDRISLITLVMGIMARAGMTAACLASPETLDMPPDRDPCAPSIDPEGHKYADLIVRDKTAETVCAWPSWHPTDTDLLAARRRRAQRTPSDESLSECVRDLASRCSHVTEIAYGTTSVSWAAAEGLAAARLRGDHARLVAVDRTPCNERVPLAQLASLVGVACDTVAHRAHQTLDPTDLLILDSGPHDRESLLKQLQQCSQTVRHLILVLSAHGDMDGRGAMATEACTSIVHAFVQHQEGVWDFGACLQPIVGAILLQRVSPC